MRLPESIFLQTVTGEYPDDDRAISPSEIDIVLQGRPDDAARRALGGRADRAGHPRLLLRRRPAGHDGAALRAAPRARPLRAAGLAAGRRAGARVLPGRAQHRPRLSAEAAGRPLGPPGDRPPGYSIAAVNEFDPLFDDIYAFCEAQDIEIDTLIHEDGAAQMEINLLHGDALDLADQVFLFKRTAREAALRHKMYATFMAKPHAQASRAAPCTSTRASSTRRPAKNIFSDKDGKPTPLFFSHIAGLQKYLPAAMSLFAPNVNSYRRITRYHMAPINVQWGYDNRTAGLRVPLSDAGEPPRREPPRRRGRESVPRDRGVARLRLPRHDRGAEALRADHRQRLRPAVRLPRTLEDALRCCARAEPLVELLGERFVLGVHRGQGKRVRHVPAGDQLLGARAPAAERLKRRAGP